jgi:protein SCO1/2
MDTMTMSYKIKQDSGYTTGVQFSPGDSIAAEVVVTNTDPKNEDAIPDYWLENVRITAHAESTPAPAANALHIPAPGEDVPDFQFTNEYGHRISLKQYRGQVLLVTFIYTRCPFPDFCPRMTSNFAEIYKQVGTNPALATTHLLSISFDPEHDTPKVLRDYASKSTPAHDAALLNRWDFAVPTAADLPKIADFFALTIKPEGGLITHNLSTAIIGSDGKIVQWYHGGDWQPSDLIKIAAAAAKP